MRVYAHWLDNEYRKILVKNTAPAAPSPDDQAVRVIKLLALLGTTIIISYSQTADSPPLFRLFASKAFRDFVRDHPDLFHLVVPFDGSVPPAHPNWAIATRGAQSAIKAGRIASEDMDSQSVLRLSEQILEAGPTADLSALLTQLPASPDRLLLEGFIRMVGHFARPGSQAFSVSTEARVPSSYLDVLEKALKNPACTGTDDEKRIVRTIELVEGLGLDSDARKRRSDVYKKLKLDEEAFHRGAWRTIVEAWNLALQDLITDDGGLMGNLQWIPVGIYSHTPTDAFFSLQPDSREAILGGLQKKKPLFIAADPTGLSWPQLSDLINATEPERIQLNAALATQDQEAIDEALWHFAEAVGGRMPPVTVSVSPVVWAVGQLLIVLGSLMRPDLKESLDVAKGVLYGAQIESYNVAALINAHRRHLVTATVVESTRRVATSAITPAQR